MSRPVRWPSEARPLATDRKHCTNQTALVIQYCFDCSCPWQSFKTILVAMLIGTRFLSKSFTHTKQESILWFLVLFEKQQGTFSKLLCFGIERNIAGKKSWIWRKIWTWIQSGQVLRSLSEKLGWRKSGKEFEMVLSFWASAYAHVYLYIYFGWVSQWWNLVKCWVN